MSRFRIVASAVLATGFLVTAVPTANANPVDDVRSTVNTTKQKVTTFQNRLKGTDTSPCGEGDLFCPILAWVRREAP